jgi:cytochrome c2
MFYIDLQFTIIKIMKIKNILSASILFGASFTLVSCGQNPNDPGTEFAPNMYTSIAYDPLSQVTVDDSLNKINPYQMNMREPVAGTVSRRNYATSFVDDDGTKTDLGLMVYNTHRDSLLKEEKTLINPLPLNKKTIEQGKVIYERLCTPCHGAEGKGNGKVGVKYQGVANLTGGAIAKANSAHIWHVITHGKGRMWSHASQLNPLERWQVANYVHVLQGQVDENGKSLLVAEEKKDSTAKTPVVAVAAKK